MVIRPESAKAGQTVELLVAVRIASAHYLHAADDSDTTFVPVAMSLVLPDGIEAVGEWQFPAPISVHGHSMGYRESIFLRRSLKVLPTALPQTLRLMGALHYQACTDELCWPKGTMELSAPLTIQSQTR